MECTEHEPDFECLNIGITAHRKKYRGADLASQSQTFFSKAGKYEKPARDIDLMTLPGHGLPGPDCGHLVAMHCNKCGHGWWAESSCLMRECPNCYEKWAFKEAKIASARLWAGTRDYYRGTPHRIMHIVVSFRDDSSRDLSDYRAEAGRILRKHGATGTAIIPHPFRQNESGHFEKDGYIHFHCIGVFPGEIKPGEPRAGYLFKVIPDAKRHDYRGVRRERDLKNLIRYLLTHCGIVKGRHSLTWTGFLSYRNLTNAMLEEKFPEMMDELREKKGRACPKCKSTDTEPCMQWDGLFRGSGELIMCHPLPEGLPPRLYG